MTGLESQRIGNDLASLPIDLSEKIKNIYDKIDRYTDKRGDNQEAIDIVNSDLLFSEDSIFASWENGVLELKEIILEDGQMKGDFHLQLRNGIAIGALELIRDYMEFMEINYKIQLNIQDINVLTEQVTNIINGFVIANENDYRIDLGEEELISMVGWEDISLDRREKKLYIKGALLKFEDDSDFITRVSKQGDTYILSGKDGSEARLSIRSTRLVLESDFVYTTKLPLYIQILNKYLLEEYKVKFGLLERKMPKTVVREKKMVKKSLFKVMSQQDVFGLFNKDNWYEEDTSSREEEIDEDYERQKIFEQEEVVVSEDIWGNPLVSDEDNTRATSGRYDEPDDTNDRDDDEEDDEEITAKDSFDRQKSFIESELEDKQLATIVIKCLKHIDKKKYTIENYKNKGVNNNKRARLKDLEKITTYMLDVNLLEIYRYFRKYLGKDKLNIAYLKNTIKEKLDVNTIGLNHYFDCGNTVKEYKSHDDEAYHDIGYSSNGLYIHASVQRNIRTIYSIQSDTQDSKKVESRPLRRYSRDGDYMIMSKAEAEEGSTKGIYDYFVHHLDSNKTFLDIALKGKEKLALTRRCEYDMVNDYLLVVGDGKVRVMAIDEDRKKDFTFKTEAESFTIATESTKLFLYSNKELSIQDLTDKKKIDYIRFSNLLGERAGVLYMHARKGQVKIIYMQDGRLKYSCYGEDDLLGVVAFCNPIANHDISIVNDINLSSMIQGVELFFSEDNKYAIFVKNNTIYTIRFTEYGVKLFTTDTMGLKHVFRVKYSPDGSHAILRDGSSIYKLDLDIIDDLQTDENLEKKLELLAERKKLVTVIGKIHQKREEERMIAEEELLFETEDNESEMELEVLTTEEEDMDKEIEIISIDEEDSLVEQEIIIIEDEVHEAKSEDIVRKRVKGKNKSDLEEDSLVEQEIIIIEDEVHEAKPENIVKKRVKGKNKSDLEEDSFASDIINVVIDSIL